MQSRRDWRLSGAERRPESQLDEWLAMITEDIAAYNAANPGRPAAPFAVNQIVHMSNKRLEHDLALCVKYKVPIVISSLGAVPEVNAAVHSYGGIVLHDVINNRHASSAIRKGADGLIAVAAGAGGHAGTLSPLRCVQEIRDGSRDRCCWQAPLPRAAPSLRRRRWAPTWPILERPSSRAEEARAADAYKQAISRAPQAISSIPTTSPACTATT